MSTTPIKNPLPGRPRATVADACENSDPNMPLTTPSRKPTRSPSIKPAASAKKPAPKTPKPAVLPHPPPGPKDRKFILAKKNTRRAEKDLDVNKRRQAAYDALRASQEGFFRTDHRTELPEEADPFVKSKVEAEKSPPAWVGSKTVDGSGDLEGSSEVRKMRSIFMEEALSSIPEPGSGRVMHLVKAFEGLLSISKEPEVERSNEKRKQGINWALPGLRQPVKGVGTEVSSYSGCSEELFASRNIERDSRLHSSLDGNTERLSLGSRTSSGNGRSRRNSNDSCGRSFDKKLKVTSQQPFKLRTEQRGRLKEEHFVKKVKEMLMEEERQRIPLAQGLPWTTDEREVLMKPPTKESTEPIDLLLHSDVRAVERAEFDNHVAGQISLAEQMRLERERLRKLEEEEEIRRLRRELVPRAQPMPYFDRPFVAKKSSRPRTIPKEPRFHIRVKSSW